MASLTKEQLTHSKFSDEARFDMNGEVNTQQSKRIGIFRCVSTSILHKFTDSRTHGLTDSRTY